MQLTKDQVLRSRSLTWKQMRRTGDIPDRGDTMVDGEVDGKEAGEDGKVDGVGVEEDGAAEAGDGGDHESSRDVCAWCVADLNLLNYKPHFPLFIRSTFI